MATRWNTHSTVWTAGLVIAAMLGLARRGQAQDTGDGFLFGVPTGSLSIRSGYALPNAGSDLFSFVTRQLTLKKSQFGAMDVDADLGFQIAPRFDLVFGAAVAGMTATSAFRDWMDNNNQPIQQATSFRRVPLTASLKMYLEPRGRSIGKFAWIPAKYSPYVGVGGGTMWYRFRQEGDFIDFQTLNVFHDTFESSGFTPMAHAFAGMEYAIRPTWSLTAEGRYQLAKAPLGQDFAGFNQLDLSGFSLTAGIAFRF